MTKYKVNVRRGPLSGRAFDGARLNILTGPYEVVHKENNLVFMKADRRNGLDITIDLADYPEIDGFPTLEPLTQLEIIE
jgi:hypothetical protein